MSKKSMLIMAGATAVTVGYALYDFKSEQKKTEVKERESIVVPWESSAIQEIEITSSEGPTAADLGGSKAQSIKLMRDKDVWRLVEPISDLADQTEANDLAEGLVKEKTIEVITEPGGLDLKIFGLDNPRGKIRLKKSSGEEMNLHISSKKNFQGDAFLRKDQENQVYSVSSSWFSKIDKKASDLRDKRLLRQPVADLEKLSFKGETHSFTLTLKDGKWIADEFPQWALDQNKVREIIQALGASIVSSTILEKTQLSEIPVAELKKYGLEKAKLHITAILKSSPDTPWKARVGQDKDKLHYMLAEDAGKGEPSRLARAVIAEVTSVEAEKFLTLRLGQLRNRSEPFDFPKQEVKKVELRLAEKKSEFEKSGDSWDPKIESLLTKLKTLQVTEFIEKKMELPGGAKSLSLKDSSGKSLLELQIGELQKKKIDGVEKSVFVAKTSLIPDIITIDENAVKELELESILPGTADKPIEKPAEASKP